VSTSGKARNFASPVVGVSGVGDAWVRPGELIVDLAAQSGLDTTLRAGGGRPYAPGQATSDWRRNRHAPNYGDINGRLQRKGLNYRLWTGMDHNAVERIVHVAKVPGLHFNHVMLAEDYYQGGPGGIPVAVAAPASPFEATGDGQPDIAVLDTGLPANWLQVHQGLKKGIVEVGTDVDPLDEDNDSVLDHDAGHGLFICGLILRAASTLTVQNLRVLHSTGETDDALLSATLAETTAPVINLSLGGYSVTDQASPMLAAAVSAAISRGQVIVAAAGNAGGADQTSPFWNRPFWPAALPGVIAVGAYDSAGGGQVLWDKSNAADVYAPGVGVLSNFVSGWASPDPNGGTPFTGWASWSGTSFAAPLVAARIAEAVANAGGANAQIVANGWLTGRDEHPTWPKKPTGSASAKICPVQPEPTLWG
jgi:hypothetical protein